MCSATLGGYCEVSLFIPCTVDIMLPEIGAATYKLLSRLGEKPLYHPEQT
jgi:Fe-S oxidoreductase